MDGLLNPQISMNRRDQQFKKKKTSLISLRKEKNRKIRLEEYFLGKRLEFNDNRQLVDNDSIFNYEKTTLNNKEYSLKRELHQDSINNYITSLYQNFSNEPKNIQFGNIHIDIFLIIEDNDSVNLKDDTLLQLLNCLKQIVLVKNEEIYEEIRKRGLIHSLLKFLSKDHEMILEETLISIGNILSDVKYDSLKYYCIENVLNEVYILLKRADISTSLIKVCFWLILTITRGKPEYNSEDCYQSVLKYLWKDEVTVLFDSLSTVKHMCENDKMIDFILLNTDYYKRIIYILLSEEYYLIRRNLLILVEFLFSSSSDFIFYETVINTGILQGFTEILNQEDMISVDHVLKCILNMSCTTIKIINMIINETELIHILFKLMTKSKNKSVLYEIMFNLMYNGDSSSSKSLLGENYFNMIISFLSEKTKSVQTLILAFHTLNKVLEFDEYLPFFLELRIKDILLEKNIILLLENTVFITNLSKNQLKLFDELMAKFTN